ncbi:MAG TPA: YafY family protein [Bacteroidales bacterium]
MNRIDRVSAILIHLQTKKFVTAEEIANRFEISKRTIYRDLKALEEAGVPLGAEPGKGYYLVDGYHLPPVMFTHEEASAMLTAEKMVEKLTDRSVSDHFQSAMMKIRSVLPEKEKQFITDLHSNIEVLYNLKSEFPNNYMSDIQFALVNRQTLTIDYKSIYKNEQTINRIIEPVGICFYSLSWHLIGWCRMRNEYRDFRVDRITRLVINKETYSPRRSLTLRQYFFEMSQTAELHEIVIRFEKLTAIQLQSVKYFYGFVDEIETDQYTEMTFFSNDFTYFARWLLMFADVVEIVSPPALKEMFDGMIETIILKSAKKNLTTS